MTQAPSPARPTAFLQVDVDGLWAVRACYGRAEGTTFEHDRCWEEGVPALAQAFADIGAPATFFLVGRDMDVPAKRAIAAELALAGHEIANHSHDHRIGITRLGPGAILDTMRRAHEAIAGAGLPEPVGFRAPGYDVDVRVLRCLRRLGYRYDASLLPTPLVPVLRAADAFLARRWQPGKRQFGRLAYVRAPRDPYLPHPNQIRQRAPAQEDAHGLWEMPVTTLPPLGLPLTGAGLLTLGPDRAIAALEKLSQRRRTIQVVLHAIDLTDCSEAIVFDTRRPGTGGFHLSKAEKAARLRPVLEWIGEHFVIERADRWVAERTAD
ncbi:MAG: polysaccharide deacetylase family protein [Sumerlaeia bacterium]